MIEYCWSFLRILRPSTEHFVTMRGVLLYAGGNPVFRLSLNAAIGCIIYRWYGELRRMPPRPQEE